MTHTRRMSRDQAVLNESSSYASRETHTRKQTCRQIQTHVHTHKLLSCLGFSPLHLLLPPLLILFLFSYLVFLLLSYAINHLASESNLSVKETVTKRSWVGAEKDRIKETSMFKRLSECVCVCVLESVPTR